MRFTVTSAFAAWLSAGGLWLSGGCATVDPGPAFVVPFENFNEDFFFCVVEPQYVVAKKCGAGDAADGNRCHFNSSAVSGMALRDHPPVTCDAAGHPVDRTQVSTGSAARSNFTAASLEMSRDALTAPILVRPQGRASLGGAAANHPKAVFMDTDANSCGSVPCKNIIQDWANKP